MLTLFNRRHSAEHALKELTEGLSTTLGPKLVSLLLYGSKASGEFREEGSDVNVFILLEDASWDTISRMMPALSRWTKAGHTMPVFMQKSELSLYAKSLPIEFLELKDHHKVVFGQDPLSGFQVDKSHLRAQCAMELSTKLLRLRQTVLLADEDVDRLRKILTDSLPSILTLYRAVLRLEGEAPAGQKIVAAKELAKRLNFDGDTLERMWDLHMRRQSDNILDLARHYLEGLERVVSYVSKK